VQGKLLGNRPFTDLISDERQRLMSLWEVVSNAAIERTAGYDAQDLEK
jgi:hypothetical protein